MELTNLNKENFFDKLYEDYPNAMQEFCNWIDEYKKENNWIELFGEKIKYHHLPIAMQIGIWCDFQFTFHTGEESITYTEDYKWSENVYQWFSEWMHHREIDINLVKD